MPLPRYSGVYVGTVTISTGAYVADVINATVRFENQQEDGRGVGDRWAYPTNVGSSWSFTGEFHADTAGTTIMEHIHGGSIMSCTFNTGVHVYTGSVIPQTGDHTFNRTELQKFANLTFNGYGAPTIA